tara:strand:- start:2020 stop:2223 length:204 start_codon:yes stop_codon:yes gene_type:complete
MSSYKDFIDAGAKMDFNPYKTNVATSQCALNYTGSSFAGGKSLKKTTTNKAPVKKTTVKKTKVSKKK